jgi:hypothetical protein
VNRNKCNMTISTYMKHIERPSYMRIAFGMSFISIPRSCKYFLTALIPDSFWPLTPEVEPDGVSFSPLFEQTAPLIKQRVTIKTAHCICGSVRRRAILLTGEHWPSRTVTQKRKFNEFSARQFERMEIMAEDLSDSASAKSSKIPTSCAIKSRVPLRSIGNLVQVGVKFCKIQIMFSWLTCN